MQILHSFKALITTHMVQKKVEQKCKFLLFTFYDIFNYMSTDHIIYST